MLPSGGRSRRACRRKFYVDNPVASTTNIAKEGKKDTGPAPYLRRLLITIL